MKFALVQLSDIHIRSRDNEVSLTENPVLERGDYIAKAVSSVCPGVQYLIIVISGDIAFSGKQIEYQYGHALIKQVRDGLKHLMEGRSPEVLSVAGNHDCDFSLSTKVREILVDSLKSADVIDNTVIEQCTHIQREYLSFESAYLTESRTDSVADRLYSRRTIEIGGKKILFHLFNSAWMSQLKENPAKLYFPVVNVKKQVSTEFSADISIAVVHHPFNWYWPGNSREFRSLLEDHADLILTGHEHVSVTYEKRIDTGEQNEYLEGGVLQETGVDDVSSFNLVIFDTERGQQQTHRFVWGGNRYSTEGESYWRPFERNKRLTRGEFEFSVDHSSFLENPGVNYTHPHKDQVVLSDLFVYPNLRENDHEKESVNQAIIRSKDVVTYLMNNSRVIIVGEEKSGKTTLSKSLIKDLHRNGKVPVLIESDKLRRCTDATKMKELIDSLLREQYFRCHEEVFWQLEQSQRSVVVDDYHKLGFNQKLKECVSKLLTERFGILIFIAGEELHFQGLTSRLSSGSILDQFKKCSVMQFGLALRHNLITKWYLLGRDYSDSDNSIDREIKRADKLISNIISVDFLPSFPVYILILLQRLGSTNKLTTTSGSFGYLYEILVSDCLLRHKSTRDEIDTLYTYLSEFAYHLFTLRRRAISEDGARAWHDSHCSAYRLRNRDFRNTIGDLAAAGVIDCQRGDIRFRYKYLYYFFVARYFSDNINKGEIQIHIISLSSRLHHEDSANIMIFLCHLSKDERILNAMFGAAKALFVDVDDFDIDCHPQFLIRANDELPVLTLSDGDPNENLNRSLESRDSVTSRADTSRIDEPAEIDDTDDGLNDEARFNAAIKTIQILGQVLKNFSGSLRGEPKKQLVEECYNLGLRSLGYLFNLAETSFPDYSESVAQRLKDKREYLSDSDLLDDIRRRYSELLQLVTYVVVKHVSESVGSEKLAQTYAEVNENTVNPSVRIIDLSIRLDYFDTFPRNELGNVVTVFSSNYFAMSLIRLIIWNHLYLFPVDYRNKQFACEKAKISLEAQAKIVAPETKTHSQTRDSSFRESDKKHRQERKRKNREVRKSKKRAQRRNS